MANYNKSFNFRNGVQVDNDNFIVNASGLVGIGTTTPAAYLDVYGISALRGNVTVSGVTSSTQSYVTGVSTFASDTFVGSGITMYASAGIVSATKFFGDASGMSGIFAVATGGWFVDSSAGIAYTTSKIGIGTTNPVGSFTVNSGTSNQVARFQSSDLAATIDFVDPTTSSDVAIGCRGSDFILETGSSRSLTVDSNGNVGIGSTLPTDLLDVKGVITSNGLNVSGISTLTNLSVTGVTTSKELKVTTVGIISALTANGIGVTSLNVTGVSTFTGIATFTTVGIADSIFHTGDSNTSIRFPAVDTITAETSGSERIRINSVGDVNVSGTTTTGNLSVTGVTTSKDTIHVFNDSTASIVAVGKSALGGYNGYFRYGETTGGFKYSNSESLDIVTYSPGSFNFIYDAEVKQTDSKIGFQWLRGGNVNPHMTLTGIGGSLGIGNTDPIHPLHVSGIATITSDLNVGGQVKANTSIISNTGNLVLTTGNINAYAGTIEIDTVTAASIGATDINVTGVSTFSEVSIGATVSIGSSLTIDNDLTVTGGVKVTGVSTFSNIDATGVSTSGVIHAKNSFTVGTTAIQTGGAIQFGNAGVTTTRYMVLPTVTTTQRNALVDKTAGALVYNSTTKKLNFWTGSAWEAVTSA